MAVGIGLVLAAVLAAVALRFRWTFTPITAFTGFLYTIPSVALFGAAGHPLRQHRRPPRSRSSATRCSCWSGTSSPASTACPPRSPTRPTASGSSRARRLLTVELPARAARHRRRHPRRHRHDGRAGRRSPRIIQLGGLGRLIFDGYSTQYYTKIVVGSALSVLLALVLDLRFNRVEVALTPVGPAAGGTVIAALLAARADEPTNVDRVVHRPARPAPTSGAIPEQLLAHGLALAAARWWSWSRSPSRSPPCWPTTAGASWRPRSRSASAGPSRPSPSSASLVIVSLRNGFGFEPWPIIIALVLLGLPPVFANTYAAVRGVEPGPGRARHGRWASTRRARCCCGSSCRSRCPVILAGVRTAAVQIIATEPLGAFFGGEGLGAYLRQGLGNQDSYQVQAGALLVTAVAIGVELILLSAGRARCCPRACGRPRPAGGPGGGPMPRSTRHRSPRPDTDHPTPHQKGHPHDHDPDGGPPRPARWPRPRRRASTACGDDDDSGTGDRHVRRRRSDDPHRPAGLRRGEDPHRGLRASTSRPRASTSTCRRPTASATRCTRPSRTTSLDLIIDYTGSAARFLDSRRPCRPDPDETYTALAGRAGEQAASWRSTTRRPRTGTPSWPSRRSPTRTDSRRSRIWPSLGDRQARWAPRTAGSARTACSATGPGRLRPHGGLQAVEYGPPLAAALDAGTVQVAQYQHDRAGDRQRQASSSSRTTRACCRPTTSCRCSAARSPTRTAATSPTRSTS